MQQKDICRQWIDNLLTINLRTMKKTLFLLFICLPYFAYSQYTWSAEIENYEFNGLSLGSSLVSLKYRFPEFSCVKDRLDSEQQTCKALMNFHRRPGVINSSQSNVSLTFRKNQLVKINVVWYPSMFKKTISDFKKYYGKPSRVAVETVLSENGDMLENQVYYWQLGRKKIAYHQYASSENLSSITFSMPRIDDDSTIKNFVTIVNWTDIAGKTAKGKDIKNDFGFKDYFSKNGMLVEVRDDGSRHRGKWTISGSGYLCLEWQDSTNCGQLKVNKDGTINLVRYTTVIRQFFHFQFGNQ